MHELGTSHGTHKLVCMGLPTRHWNSGQLISRNPYHNILLRQLQAHSNNQHPNRRPSSPSSAQRGAPTHAVKELWGVEPVLEYLRRKQLEPATVARVYEADVYPCVLTFEGWRRHRSRERYTEHMITLFRSYLLKDLTGPLMNCVAIAVFVCIYNTFADLGYLPHSEPITSAWEPFNLMSFALSLMLVFRTNSSYARWVEGRGLWGQLVNSTRSLIRQVLTTLPDSATDVKVAVARWAVAFARVSKLHLREEGSLELEVMNVLRQDEVEILQDATDRPAACLQVISQLVASVPGVDSNLRASIETEISSMQMSIGSCEKILRNPIPLSYTRHTARFLVLWLNVLPFSLWDGLGWGTVPATAVISFLLLGIDEIAIQLEEPFGILPLENLCDNVQRDCKQMLDEDQRIKSVARAYAVGNGSCPQAPDGWGVAPQSPSTTFASDSDADMNIDHIWQKSMWKG